VAKGIDRALSAYRVWKRLATEANAFLSRADEAISAARRKLADLASKLSKESAEAGGSAATDALGGACPYHSFDPSTPVLMANGTTKPIKDVAIGDDVVATDPITGKTYTEHVTALHNNIDTDLTDVTVTNRRWHQHHAAHHPTPSILGRNRPHLDRCRTASAGPHTPHQDCRSHRHPGPQLHRHQEHARPHRRKHPHVLCGSRGHAGPRPQLQHCSK
jgi:hypothetical protein